MPLRRIVISGCSGGGKSTLIAALTQRGYQTVPEAGRIVVQIELASGGTALPWIDTASFIEKLASLAISQFDEAAKFDGPVFFDRCVVEALVASRRFGIELPSDIANAALACRYDNCLFIAPPWPEIFESDSERRHSFEEAVLEYEVLFETFVELGYSVFVLPIGYC